MKAHILIPALLATSACASTRPWLKRDLTYRDLEERRAEIVGQKITILAAVEERFTGGSPPILWLSAAARAHAFGASRANYCIWANDKTGKLAALKPWTIVRVKGMIRIDESIVPKVMECPSTLTVVTSSVDVLPAGSTR